MVKAVLSLFGATRRLRASLAREITEIMEAGREEGWEGRGRKRRKTR